jgi:hypothetical protein
MSKEKKQTKGRVIELSKADNILLKKYLLYCEETGVTLSNTEICSNLFSIGLHQESENLFL